VDTDTAARIPGTNPIPRFTREYNTCIVGGICYTGPFVSIGLCQTTLLYPFVTANPAGGLGQGFDTGIAVANTSKDPFVPLLLPTSPPATYSPTTGALLSGGTIAQIGSCTLYPYGVTLSATGVPGAAPNVLPGCDAIAGGVPYSNCFPVVKPGTVETVLASTVFPTFQGYVIAVCNFQYAHGYAAVTDLGLRGLFASYLALELAGSPRGVSIEILVH